jgi:putative iron-dependent peroxidase
MKAQPQILASLPLAAKSLTFQLAPGSDFASALQRLGAGFSLREGVVGLGTPLLAALGREVVGLRTFPSLAGPGCVVPATQRALWVWLQGAPTQLFDSTERVKALLGNAFVLDDALDLFTYAGGRDLTGYEDGTENPKGDEAMAAAIQPDGSSFVAVQRWVHDLARFRAFGSKKQDDTIGRRRETNEEFAEAPENAHVKRAARESFEPPLFNHRRSMPWARPHEQGLEFIAFCESLDRYERVLRRMAGLEDGVVDALFSFSRPVTGGYFWCPPAEGDRLDLRALR